MAFKANKRTKYMSLKHLIVIGLLGSTPLSIFSQEVQNEPVEDFGTIEKEKTELVLYFRFDRSLVDYGYRDNQKVLSAMQKLFADSLFVSRIDSIQIKAFTSPEGNPVYNRRLALNRAHAVKGYLIWKYPGLNQQRIQTSSHAENWEELQETVENDTLIPCRSEILQILALNTTNMDKGKLLKKLNEGIPYRYLSRRVLPDLRNASVCTVYVRPMKHPKSGKPVANSLCDVEKKRNISSFEYIEGGDFSTSFRTAAGERHQMTTGKEHGMPAEDRCRKRERNVPRRPLFAVKTNLLFDAAMMPNIELELPLGKRWSLNAEYMFPWWLIKDNKYCLQILMGGLEGRFWLGKRNKQEVLTGHFLGLYAGGGKYDLQWNRNGYQGEFFIASGLSYGYAHKIAQNLRLEYNIGIGLLRTDYRHYHARDNYKTLLWQENGNYTWFGPTKLKISLVWMISKKLKMKD